LSIQQELQGGARQQRATHAFIRQLLAKIKRGTEIGKDTRLGKGTEIGKDTRFRKDNQIGKERLCEG
jgi:hypothetical protein